MEPLKGLLESITIVPGGYGYGRLQGTTNPGIRSFDIDLLNGSFEWKDTKNGTGRKVTGSELLALIAASNPVMAILYQDSMKYGLVSNAEFYVPERDNEFVPTTQGFGRHK